MADYSDPAAAAHAVADPATTGADLQAIAAAYPQLWSAIAAHPQAYDELLDWLAAFGDAQVRTIVTQRRAGSTRRRMALVQAQPSVVPPVPAPSIPPPVPARSGSRSLSGLIIGLAVALVAVGGALAWRFWPRDEARSETAATAAATAPPSVAVTSALAPTASLTSVPPLPAATSATPAPVALSTRPVPGTPYVEYTNPVYGFRFQVPADFTPDEPRSGGALQVWNSPDGQVTVTVWGRATGSESIADQISAFLTPPTTGSSVTYSASDDTSATISGYTDATLTTIYYSHAHFGPVTTTIFEWSYPAFMADMVNAWVENSYTTFVPAS